MAPQNQSEVLFAAISAAGDGDNELVAAVTARRIRVLGFFFVVAAAVTVRFESSAGGDALTGLMSMAAAGDDLGQHNPLGLFQTVAGENLNLELGGAVQVSGGLVYVLTD